MFFGLLVAFLLQNIAWAGLTPGSLTIQNPPSFSITDGKVKVLFVDRDGTLLRSKSGKSILWDEDDFEFITPVVRSLTEWKKKGYLIALVTNHAWVPVQMSHDIATSLIEKSIKKIEKIAGIGIDFYDYAADDLELQKPNIGMAKHLSAELRSKYSAEIDWSQSFMMGDDGYGKNTTDSEFAQKLGMPFILVPENPGDDFNCLRFIKD